MRASFDPASGRDETGGVLVDERHHRRDRLAGRRAPASSEDVEVQSIATAACLAPGLVDMRVQLREPGEEHKETIETGSQAAAAGGVTTWWRCPTPIR